MDGLRSDGSTMIRYNATGGARPGELGRNVAQVLLKRGAQAILDIVYEAEPAPTGPCDSAEGLSVGAGRRSGLIT